MIFRGQVLVLSLFVPVRTGQALLRGCNGPDSESVDAYLSPQLGHMVTSDM